MTLKIRWHNPIKKIPFLLLILLLGCCKVDSSFDVLDDFINLPKSSIKSEEIHLFSDTTLFNPLDITVFDTLGVFGDNSTKSAFSLINLNNGKLLRRFAFAGKGPGEMDIMAVYITRLQNKNKFILYESNPPRRLFKYCIDSIVAQDIYNPPPFFSLPAKYPLLQAVYFRDSILIGVNGHSRINSLLSLINIGNKKHKAFNEIKYQEKDQYYLNPAIIGWTLQVLNGKIAIHPTENKIAYFSYKGAIMDISEICTKKYLLNRIFFKRFYLPSFHVNKTNYTQSVILNQDCRMGFNDIAVTNEKLYVLYNGKTITNENSMFLYSNILLVYNWKGTPLEIIELDHTLNDISIDPYHPSILYGLHSYDSISVVKFDLSKSH